VAQPLSKEHVQHSTTHCDKLQHTATHCKAQQQIAAHCNALQQRTFFASGQAIIKRAFATDFNTL